MKTLFKNAHLVIDRNIEYLKASLLIEDERILDVFLDNKLVAIDAKTIDVKGNVIMPAMFDIYHQKGESNKGLADYIDDNEINIKDNNKLFVKNDYVINELFLDTGIFNKEGTSLTNEAFRNDRYVTINIYDLEESVLRLLLNNIHKDKLILISGRLKHPLYKQIIKLRKLNISFSDIYGYVSLNPYELYKMDKENGSLRRGKYANIIVLDNDGNILHEFKRGKQYV